MTAPNAADAPPDVRRAARPEIGRPANIGAFYSTRGTVQYGPRYADPNPVLQFPLSVQTFDVMSRTDDQIGAVLRAVRLPLEDAPWDLDTKDVPRDVVEFVRQQIGLPEPGKALPSRRRGSAGVVFSDHLAEVLDVLTYGFMPFEQVWTVTVPGDPGHPQIGSLTNRPVVQLKKLGARPPATLVRINLDRDGGLASVIQRPADGDPQIITNGGQALEGLEIPVDKLVWYVNARKGADWTGVSILRESYRPWKIKEQLCNLDVLSAERAAMGVPIVKYEEDGDITREEALEIATDLRAGSRAGIAVPTSIAVEWVNPGQVLDLGDRIDRYNQAIGRASLAMFLNLGHDNGARSLGDIFIQFFRRSEMALGRNIATTFTEHVIRDLVEKNFGPDMPFPRLTLGEITAESLPPDALKTLVDADLVRADDELETYLRRQYRLPPADAKTSRKEASAAQSQEEQANSFQPAAQEAKPAAEEDPAAADEQAAEDDDADPEEEDPKKDDPPKKGRRTKASSEFTAGYAAYLAEVVRSSQEFVERDSKGRWAPDPNASIKKQNEKQRKENEKKADAAKVEKDNPYGKKQLTGSFAPKQVKVEKKQLTGSFAPKPKPVGAVKQLTGSFAPKPSPQTGAPKAQEKPKAKWKLTPDGKIVANTAPEAPKKQTNTKKPKDPVTEEELNPDGSRPSKKFANKKAGADWANANLKPNKKLNGTEKNHIEYYTGNGYSQTNKQLRTSKGKYGELEGLDSAINKSTIPENITVSRGTGKSIFGLPPSGNLSSIVGKTYTEHGYTSTSISRDTAFTGTSVKMNIGLPKGSKGLWVSGNPPLSVYGDQEGEIILPRGTQFKINSATKKGDVWIVEADVVPIEEAA